MDDYNQDYSYQPPPNEIREARVKALKARLAVIDFEIYKTLAQPSCGVIDPHFRAREKAADRLARILIPPT